MYRQLPLDCFDAEKLKNIMILIKVSSLESLNHTDSKNVSVCSDLTELWLQEEGVRFLMQIAVIGC